MTEADIGGCDVVQALVVAPLGVARDEGTDLTFDIAAPGGLERRTEVWFGVSLLAPRGRCPDHSHPPEVTCLVMVPGEFSQDDGPWFEPGVGGSFHNPPGILHAMRAAPVPLFAFWLLPRQPAAAA